MQIIASSNAKTRGYNVGGVFAHVLVKNKTKRKRFDVAPNNATNELIETKRKRNNV